MSVFNLPPEILNILDQSRPMTPEESRMAAASFDEAIGTEPSLICERCGRPVIECGGRCTRGSLAAATCLLMLMCCSCAVTYEKMGAQPKSYTYLALQLGGAGESHGSSGAGTMFDGQKSFSDALTAGTLVAGSMAQKAVGLAKEATARNVTTTAAQTKQAQIAADLAAKELAAKGAATSEAIKAGAELTPVTVTAP